MHIHTYIHTYINTHIITYTVTYVHIYIHIHTCIPIYMAEIIHIIMYIVYIYIYIYIIYSLHFMQYIYIRDIPWVRTHIDTMLQQLQVTHCSNSSHQLSMRFILTSRCAVQEIKVLGTLSLSSIGHGSSAIEISHTSKQK